jgi:hypothetical protein
MTGHCDKCSGKCNRKGQQFPLFLVDNLVVYSPIDRADVTPHTIALVKGFEYYHTCKIIVPKFGMAETRFVRGGSPRLQTI